MLPPRRVTTAQRHKSQNSWIVQTLSLSLSWRLHSWAWPSSRPWPERGSPSRKSCRSLKLWTCRAEDRTQQLKMEGMLSTLKADQFAFYHTGLMGQQSNKTKPLAVAQKHFASSVSMWQLLIAWWCMRASCTKQGKSSCILLSQLVCWLPRWGLYILRTKLPRNNLLTDPPSALPYLCLEVKDPPNWEGWNLSEEVDCMVKWDQFQYSVSSEIFMIHPIPCHLLQSHPIPTHASIRFAQKSSYELDSVRRDEYPSRMNL